MIGLLSLVLPAWAVAMIVLEARSGRVVIVTGLFGIGHRRNFLCRQFADPTFSGGRPKVGLALVARDSRDVGSAAAKRPNCPYYTTRLF